MEEEITTMPKEPDDSDVSSDDKVKSEGSEIQNKSQRRRSTFSIFRDWVSGIWESFTSSFTAPVRRPPRPRQKKRSEKNSNLNPKPKPPKSRKAKTGRVSITRPTTETEMAEKVKRDYHSHLLVLGLAGAGKSRVIEQLIQRKLPKDSSTTFTEIDAGRLKIIEAPGMSTGAGFETDASTVATIRNYLEKVLPVQIPSATLLVARFDDNRFEGEGSDFSRMLGGVKYLKKQLTNHGLTNVILVLTFGDAEEEANVNFKLSRFLTTFDTIFPESSRIRVVVLRKRDGDANKVNVMTELCALASERQDFSFLEDLYALKLLGNSDSYAIKLNPETEFCPPQSTIYRVMDEMRNGRKSSIYSDKSELSDSEDSDDSKENDQILFPVTVPYIKMGICDVNLARTLLRKGTLVRMADCSEMTIDAVRVGDKLLNIRLRPDCVESLETTTLRKWKENETGKEPTIALVYCSYLERNLNDGRVLQYSRGRVRMMPYVQPLDPVAEDETLYCIRMNNLDGTFIADNCVFKHRIPPYPESTRL